MNFRKIQWIFLIIFISLDCFLFYSWKQMNPNVNYNNNSSSVIKEMESDSISLPKTLSSSERSGYYLSGDINNQELINQSKEQVQLTNLGIIGSLRHNISSINNSVIYKNIVNGSHYKYNKKMSDVLNRKVFLQKTKYGYIFDSTGEIRVRSLNSYASSYIQNYVYNIKALREKMPTISEKKALISLYQNNEITNNTKILWGQFGYSKLLETNKKYIFIPTWIFALKEKNANYMVIKRVNAFNGSVIKTSNSTVQVDNN